MGNVEMKQRRSLVEVLARMFLLAPVLGLVVLLAVINANGQTSADAKRQAAEKRAREKTIHDAEEAQAEFLRNPTNKHTPPPDGGLVFTPIGFATRQTQSQAEAKLVAAGFPKLSCQTVLSDYDVLSHPSSRVQVSSCTTSNSSDSYKLVFVRGYLWKFEWRPNNYRPALALMLKTYGEHPDYDVTHAGYKRAEKTGRITPTYAHELPARALAERRAQLQKRNQECEQDALQGTEPKDDCPLMDYAIWKPHSGHVLIATEHGGEPDPSINLKDGAYMNSQPPLIYGADSWFEAELMDTFHEDCLLRDGVGKPMPFVRTLEITCNQESGCTAQCIDVQH